MPIILKTSASFFASIFTNPWKPPIDTHNQGEAFEPSWAHEAFKGHHFEGLFAFSPPQASPCLELTAFGA